MIDIRSQKLLEAEHILVCPKGNPFLHLLKLALLRRGPLGNRNRPASKNADVLLIVSRAEGTAANGLLPWTCHNSSRYTESFTSLNPLERHFACGPTASGKELDGLAKDTLACINLQKENAITPSMDQLSTGTCHV